jgi:beta-galactosidase
MFAVEVQDAQGRTMPIADNRVNFKLTGPGAVIGVGNGDPTSHESDIGGARKAFNGFCIAVVQSAKTAGNIIVEANSPGLIPSSVTISSAAVKLRPQVPVWEREVPAGTGVTGLWRPVPVAANAGRGGGNGGGDSVFTLRQNGAALTGSVEGGGRGGDSPVAIEDGKVDGDNVSFRVGTVTYAGNLKAGQLELQRTGGAFGGRGGRGPAAPTTARPAIGPPPDGSDPSNFGTIAALTGTAAGRGGGQPQTPAPLVLRKVAR